MFCGVCTGISGVKGLGKLVLVEEGNPANALVCGRVGVCGGRGKEGGAEKGRKSATGGEWREEKRGGNKREGGREKREEIEWKKRRGRS